MTATIFRPAMASALISAALGLSGMLAAHPIPDVPVNTAFRASGEAVITIDLDMRCLDRDPENARYIYFSELDSFTESERAESLDGAKSLVNALVEFEFKPGGQVEPEFAVEFVAKPGAELEQTQDVLFLRARASLQVPDGTVAYRIRAVDHGDLTVYFFNEIHGVAVSRFQALFPGETSYWLDLVGGPPQDSSIGTAERPDAGNPAPAAVRTSRSSSWLFIALTILIAATLSIFLIRRSSARS